jgi:hypothetical protein
MGYLAVIELMMQFTWSGLNFVCQTLSDFSALFLLLLGFQYLMVTPTASVV